jgi:O-antigen/teichoic acid export membrane protein
MRLFFKIKSKMRKIVNITSKFHSNIFWMLLGNGIKVLSGILVTAYVARQLGVELFGIIAYSLSILTILMVISRLGMESLLVRNLARIDDSQDRNSNIGMAYYLMQYTSLLVFVSGFAVVYYIFGDVDRTYVILIITISVLFQPMMVIDYNFQSQCLNAVNFKSKVFSIIIGSFVKIFLAWSGHGVMVIAAAYVLEPMLYYAMQSVSYNNIEHQKPILSWVYNSKKWKSNLLQSTPLVITGLLGILLTRFDHFYIDAVLGVESLSIYSVAVRFYESWIMFPQIVALAIIPILTYKLDKSKGQSDPIIQALIINISLSILFVVACYFGSEYVINLLFGREYIEASNVLIVLSYTTIFMSIGSLYFRVLINENNQKKIAIILLLTLVLNIILNLILVESMGVIGSAYAMLLSVGLVYSLFFLFDPSAIKIRHSLFG